MADALDYSIVIPAYNEEALLPETLRALRVAMAEIQLAGEIVVCDNNSSDRTAEAARAGGARVVFEGVNQISRARNAAARATTGRYLVFVDADTHLPPAVLRQALACLTSGTVCGGGSAVFMPGLRGRIVPRMVAFWNVLARARRLAAGSFVFARREAFFDVGGFSEGVYASEEIWLSRALRRWGRRRGLAFEILREAVLTSPRKAEWYPAPVLLGVFVLIALCPVVLRSRRLCWLWYRRPVSAT